MEITMKLTIIIPAYNAYKFLEDLVPNLAKQLTEDTELIIMDDGSTDELKSTAMPMVHHLDGNYGVSAARNAGVRIANGEYIAFVDADDQVSDDFVSNILEAIYEDKSSHDIYWFKASCEDSIGHYHVAPVWAKIYKKNIFKDVSFDETLKVGGDIRFVEETKSYSCKKIDKTIYHYRWSANPDSLSKKHNRGEL